MQPISVSTRDNPMRIPYAGNESDGLTNKKADELLGSLKDSNKKLYSKLSKLERNTHAGKNDARIKSDKHQADIVRGNSNANARKYAKEKTGVKAKTDIVVKSVKAVTSSSHSDKRNEK